VRRALPFVLLVLTAPCGWLACNIIFGIDPPELAPPKPDTGRPPEDAGCVVAHWPEAPRTEDGSGNVGFIVALKEIGLSTDPPTPVTGYDLDGVCTCPGPEACVPRVAEAGAHCDEPGGRDLSMNKNVYAVISQSPGFSADRLNANLTKGRYGILARVENYNGGKNDKSVRVSVYLSSGTPGDAGPSWDGGDPWDLDPASLTSDAGPPVSQYVDDTAYVADGVLVASKLSGVKLALGVGSESIDLELAQAVMTAKVVARGDAFALEDGLVVGRWPTKNVLKAVAPLNAPGLGVPLCSPIAKALYDYAKTSICRAADISSNPARDPDKGADCDALSFGMRFVAEPAKFGGIRAKIYVDAGCKDWNDDCTK
jgi:hypothetical protein